MKYLFFDLDGTILAGGYENSYIPESCVVALKKLKEAGHFLSICTGRSHAMAIDLMHKLDFHNMVSDGGYGIVLNDEFLGIKPLNRDDVIELLKECDEKSLPWGIQVDNSATRITPDERFYDMTQDSYMKTVMDKDLNLDNYNTFYKAYVACEYPTEKELKSLEKLPWIRFHSRYIFIEPSDKGSGIKKVMDILKADYKDVIVFGDSRNDLSMFCDEWYNVAMGNAIDELKEKADYVTSNAEDDGIYNACVKLNLFNDL